MFSSLSVRFCRSVVAATAVLAVTAVILAAAGAAWAMRVSPMVSELTTTGVGSAARIEVGNIGSVALPFETRITRMDVDAEGNITETDADEDFLVFPPQGVVPRGGRQVVRVQWVGNPDIDTSHAYYLWVRQLPVETDPNATPEDGGAVSVQVLYTMKALIVVAPPGAEPKVEIVSVKPTMVAPPAPEIDPTLTGDETPPPPPEEPGVEIVVSNSGKRYALMSGATWILEGTDTSGQPFSREYKTEEVSQLVGVGYLAPGGGRRTFKLPTGAALDPAKPLNLRFAR
jgi:fimbrial chaperone protein